MPDAPDQIRDLGREHREACASLLCDAFESDPLFLAAFGQDRAHKEAFTRMMFDKQRMGSGTLRGLFRGNALEGCYLLDSPAGWARTALDTLIAMLAFMPLIPRIPRRSTVLLNDYMRLTRRALPSDAHYLVMIAVSPRRQGHGAGRKMLEEVLQRAAADPRHRSVALDTENASNIRLYQHFGFRLVEEVTVGPLRAYCMQHDSPT